MTSNLGQEPSASALLQRSGEPQLRTDVPVGAVIPVGARVVSGKRSGTVRQDHDGHCDWEGCRHELCVEVLVDGESSPRNFSRSELLQESS